MQWVTNTEPLSLFHSLSLISCCFCHCMCLCFLREWLRSSFLPFAASNPDTQFKTELKRNRHPIIRGTYSNGNSKTICVKNLEPKRIHEFAMFLRNQIGYKMNGKYKKPIMKSENTSIQGCWHERMDLIPLKMNVELYYSTAPTSSSTASSATATENTSANTNQV